MWQCVYQNLQFIICCNSLCINVNLCLIKIKTLKAAKLGLKCLHCDLLPADIQNIKSPTFLNYNCYNIYNIIKTCCKKLPFVNAVRSSFTN